MQSKRPFIILIISLCLGHTLGYSAFEDARIINEYKRNLRGQNKTNTPELNHAQIARKLVHQADWASVGTISVNSAIKDYPMVNIISINDVNGHIQFLLTDLDFTGPDWRHNNKASFLFTDQQLLHCSNTNFIWDNKIDPMEPTCARTIISGQIVKIDKYSEKYDSSLVAFVERHPAAKNWLKVHAFYLCELDIQNIFVLDYYGGPHNVTAVEYYNTNP